MQGLAIAVCVLAADERTGEGLNPQKKLLLRNSGHDPILERTEAKAIRQSVNRDCIFLNPNKGAFLFRTIFGDYPSLSAPDTAFKSCISMFLDTALER
jgi:hypothetical protein